MPDLSVPCATLVSKTPATHSVQKGDAGKIQGNSELVNIRTELRLLAARSVAKLANEYWDSVAFGFEKTDGKWFLIQFLGS